MIEDFIFARLRSLVSDRVYPNQAPPDTPFPYIVYKQVSGVPLDSGGTMIHSDRWQIDSYPNEYRAGKILARAIRAAIPTTGVHDSICVIRVEHEGPEDMYDNGVERHYQSSDLLIQYEE